MKAKAFWDRVKALAREKGISQAIVAEACGVQYGTFRNWLSKSTIPPLDVASGLAGYFNVSIDYLTWGKTPCENARIDKFINLMEETNRQLREIQKKI